MTNKSNNQGRAFEYAFINILFKNSSKYQTVEIIHDSSFMSAERAWGTTSVALQTELKKAAEVACLQLFKMEQNLVLDTNEKLRLSIQPDSAGVSGDVRDIVATKSNWEIGFSLKHNHFAVKHNRIARNLDFGARWYGVDCSSEYKRDIDPIFDYIDECISLNLNWNDINDKMDRIYKPLLNSFMNEIKRAYGKDEQLPVKLVEFLLGKNDFYKVVALDQLKRTVIQSYNIHGSLGEGKNEIDIPAIKLPSRLVSIGFLPGKKNVVEMVFDNNWRLTFRIHNASTKVEKSLKFDIQLNSVPNTIKIFNCFW